MMKTSKRILALLLAMVMICGAALAADGENGNSAASYSISTAEELFEIAEMINNGENQNASIFLENDITVDGSWEPLGKNSVFAFRGSFEGNGHSVTVTVDDPNLSYFGFFGCLENAEVKNLTVNGEVYCSEPYAYVGGIAARARGNVTLENCINNAAVSAYARGCAGVGGIIGGYDDAVEYKYENIRLVLENCVNNGVIMVTGEDTKAFAGGIVGSNQNCVQLISCENNGDIYAGGVWVGGLLGQAGYKTGDFEPSIYSCLSTGALFGAPGKTNRLYGKGTIREENIVDSGDNTNASSSQIDDMLLAEAQKYRAVINAASSVKVGESLTALKDNASKNEDISVSFSRGEKDITKGYTKAEGDEITLLKRNLTSGVISETATICFADNAGNALRKPVMINIYPSEAGVYSSLMNSIAETYRGSVGEWVVFDMAAYERLGFGENTTDIENYSNYAANKLAGNVPLATDRAKAEIIFAALGIDSANITPFESTESYSNAEKLANMDLGTSVYGAPWFLLAEEAGRLELSENQRNSLISLIISAQGENGLFYSIWGGEKYDDVDTTATALAALARFYGTNAKVTAFAGKALAGLSAAQGENGSFGNINSDAMVIIGLAAMGIDPRSDSDFVKNGTGLASAAMLYANDNGNGFETAYISGTSGEKARKLATEQGFRALVVLNYIEENGIGSGLNIYTLKDRFGAEAALKAELLPFAASGYGTAESDNSIGGGSNEEDTTGGNSENEDNAAAGGTSKNNIKVSVRIVADNNEEWLSLSTEMPSGSSAAELLKKALSDSGMSADGIDEGYIKSVSKNSVKLSQFDKGKNSGWLYRVNNEAPSVGILDYKLKAGDEILLYYVADYEKDGSSSKWRGSSSGGGSGSTAAEKENTENAKEQNDKADVITAENGKSETVVMPKDVPSNAWFAEAAEFVIEKGLMNGVSKTEFAPEEKLSRAMFVTILYRLSGEPDAKASAFTDVSSGDWFEKAVCWASENGIVSGITETEFAPLEDITREQMAVIIYRFMKVQGKDVSVGEETNILSFGDSDEISEFAAAAIGFVVGSGVMNGSSQTSFSPKGTATRAMAAMVIMRLVKENFAAKN